jgi:hypothetical protein
MKRSNKCYDLVGLELNCVSSGTKRLRCSEANQSNISDFSDNFKRIVTLAAIPSSSHCHGGCEQKPSLPSTSLAHHPISNLERRTSKESFISLERRASKESFISLERRASKESFISLERRASKESFSSPLATLFIL